MRALTPSAVGLRERPQSAGRGLVRLAGRQGPHDGPLGVAEERESAAVDLAKSAEVAQTVTNKARAPVTTLRSRTTLYVRGPPAADLRGRQYCAAPVDDDHLVYGCGRDPDLRAGLVEAFEQLLAPEGGRGYPKPALAPMYR